MNHSNEGLDLFPPMEAVPPAFRFDGPVEQREVLVDGRLEVWNGPCQDVVSPVRVSGPDGPAAVRLGSYPLQGADQALAALDAARRAYDGGRGAWPTMGVEDRIRHVADFVEGMRSVRDEVIRLICWEIGKSAADAAKEFDRTIAYIRDTVDALKDLDRAASRFVIDDGVFAQIRRAPLGVTLCMGPFNYPLNETLTTLIPALCMGNVVVFKPPKLGVLLHGPLLAPYRDAFPPGVVNTVYGEGRDVVGPLMTSGHVDVLAFIGTSRVADVLRDQHPKPHRLRCVLGLEAKNAAIVLPDADLDLAVRECALGALSFNGQRCTALKILFVHESIADAFLARLSEAVGRLPVGPPWVDGVAVTPLAEPGKVAWLCELLEDAVSRGARVVNRRGGEVVETVLRPAIVHPVSADMRLWSEEQFGPVVPVAEYADVSEPLRWVRESDYGQQVSVFGSDPVATARLVDSLVHQVCRVNINGQCQRGPDTFPFTGRKDSAEGTLSVTEALRAFSLETMVAARQDAANVALVRRIVTERHSSFLSTDFLF